MNLRNLSSLVLLCPFFSFGQSLELVSPSGAQATNSAYQVSYSIGELNVQTASDETSTVVTQGFHQSKLTITGIHDPSLGFSINLYPNPTSDRVVITASALERISHFRLYDQRGRLVLEQRNQDSERTEIDLSQLSNGTYILRSTVDQSGQAFSHQIIKSF